MQIEWYKSKQFWFNVLAVIITIATAFDFDTFTPDPRILVISQALIAVVNVILRFALPSNVPSLPFAKSADPATHQTTLAIEYAQAKTKHANRKAAIVYTALAFIALAGTALAW